MPAHAASFILDLVNAVTALFAAALLTPLTMIAGAPAIGVVTASGHFTLDRARVWGNATLFSGGRIETDAASSQVNLANGVRIQLAANSSASILDNRLTLLTGSGQLVASPVVFETAGYEIAAGGFAIRPNGTGARVHVSWGAGGTLEIGRAHV